MTSTGGIDTRVLMLTRGLKLVASTGLILVLPWSLTARLFYIADRIGYRIIGDSLLAWAEDTVDEAIDQVLDGLLGEAPEVAS